MKSKRSSGNDNTAVKARRSGHRSLFRTCVNVGLFVVILAVLLIWFFDVHIVRNDGMYPGICEGQLIVISKTKTILRDSVVYYMDPNGDMRVGRIVASGDDTVNIIDGSGVFLSGSLENPRWPLLTSPGDVLEYPLTVGENEYFILNDYRENMSDSRLFGCISADDIVGVVVFAMQYRGF